MKESQQNIVNPSVSDNSFVGKSGTVYVIHPSLTAGRFEYLERLQIELQYGTTLSAFRQEASEVYTLLNEGRFADAAVKQHGVVHGSIRIDERRKHPLMLICSLFIAAPNEDLTTWNEAEAAEKINDWSNVDMAFFLALRRRFLQDFTRFSDTDFQHTSPENQTEASDS